MSVSELAEMEIALYLWTCAPLSRGEIEVLVESARRQGLVVALGDAQRPDGSLITEPEWTLRTGQKRSERSYIMAREPQFESDNDRSHGGVLNGGLWHRCRRARSARHALDSDGANGRSRLHRLGFSLVARHRRVVSPDRSGVAALSARVSRSVRADPRFGVSLAACGVDLRRRSDGCSRILRSVGPRACLPARWRGRPTLSVDRRPRRRHLRGVDTGIVAISQDHHKMKQARGDEQLAFDIPKTSRRQLG